MSNKIVFEIGIGFHTSTVIKTEVKINDINFVFEYYPSFGMLTIDRVYNVFNGDRLETKVFRENVINVNETEFDIETFDVETFARDYVHENLVMQICDENEHSVLKEVTLNE